MTVDPHTEFESTQLRRETRTELQSGIAFAHPAEPARDRRPYSGQGSDVESLVCVAVQVVEVERCNFRQVVVGQFEMPDLCSDDRLYCGRERGVPHSERLVVPERARLLFCGECTMRKVQRQDEVGLLDYLLPIQIEVREVLLERVLIGSGAVEVPMFEIRVAGGL